jgi:hypothetical protein
MTKAVKQSFTYQTRWDGPRTPPETLQFGAGRVDDFSETSVEVSVSVKPVG